MLKMMSTSKFFSVFVLSAITVMITIAFVFWGIGPQDNQAIEIIAQIEDTKISLDQYWRTYDNEYKRQREQGVSAEEIDEGAIKGSVIERLINRTVLMIVAENSGITVTEEELQNEIMNTPYFQNNGVFDQNIYIRALRLNRTSPRDYENSLKNDMIVTKMSRLIGETAELTSDEIKILDSIEGGNKAQLSEVFRSSKSNMAIQAYVQGMRRKMDITVNKDLI